MNVFEKNNVRLLQGDCMDLMKETPDNFYELAIVDPPYGLGDSVVNSGGRFKRYENKKGNWDKEIPKSEYFEELFRVSKNQIIWGGNYFPLPSNKCFIVWDKKQPEGISFAMAEYAWASFDKVAQIFKTRSQGQELRFHPTQKPVKLYEWLLMNYAKEGDKILDTHLGSASSAIAAHRQKFDFTGIELDDEYYTAAVKRFKQQTAQTELF